MDAQTETGLNIEVKSGLQGPGARSRLQIAKDKLIKANAPQVTGTELHFYPSAAGVGPRYAWHQFWTTHGFPISCILPRK